MLQDLKGLHLEGSAQVVTGTFPTCWEVVMDDRYATGPADEPGDIFARYGCRGFQSWARACPAMHEDWLTDFVFSIRLPHLDGIFLCFKGTSAGAPVSSFECLDVSSSVLTRQRTRANSSSWRKKGTVCALTGGCALLPGARTKS